MFEFLSSIKFRSKKTGRRLQKDIEPQEIFLDQLAQKKEAELGIRERKLEVPVSRKILRGIFFFIIVFLLILFAKTFQFQILENEKYSVLANENKFIFYSIKAERGVIYDSQGEQVVFNEPSFDLVLDKDKLPEDQSERTRVLEEISQIINQDYHEFENETLIVKNLDHETLILLETKIAQFPGFQIERSSIRYYKEGSSFAHIIGYTGKESDEEYIGRDGLEKSYEEILRKNPGKTRVERDVYGNPLSKEIVSLPESGKSLVLWLDSGLEKKIEQVLGNILENTGAEKAVGVALDPKTGGVMALVSLPTYDNNLFSKGSDQQALGDLLVDPQQPLFNRAVSGLYSTGSVIKPLIALAALEEEIISPSKKINCEGGIIIPHRYDPEIVYEYKDWRVHGLTNMQKAIAESCNVYFYTIGGGYKNQQGLGPSTIKKYLELFGWGKETGIDLPAEADGLIPFPDWKKEVKGENWWDGDTYNLSIGQGDIKVSPLQVATAFVAIANKGILYKPQVVKQVIDKEKNLIEEIRPEVLRENFIDLGNIEIVRQGMRKAVTGQGSPYASATLLNSLPVPVAAKTGTAETFRSNYYHNWIAVFAPYDDPEIVLIIMIENVKDLQAAALPTAKEVLQWYFSK